MQSIQIDTIYDAVNSENGVYLCFGTHWVFMSRLQQTLKMEG